MSQIMSESKTEKANLRRSNSSFLKTKYAGQKKRNSLGPEPLKMDDFKPLIEEERVKKSTKMPGDIDKYFKSQIADIILKKYESKNLEE
jgi:hypothetical protein